MKSLFLLLLLFASGQTSEVSKATPIPKTSVQTLQPSIKNPTDTDQISTAHDPNKTSSSTFRTSQTTARAGQTSDVSKTTPIPKTSVQTLQPTFKNTTDTDQISKAHDPNKTSSSTFRTSQTTARAGNHSTDKGQTSDVSKTTPIPKTSVQTLQPTFKNTTDTDQISKAHDPNKTSSSTFRTSQTTARAGNHSTDKGQTSDVSKTTPIPKPSVQTLKSTMKNPPETDQISTTYDPNKTSSSTFRTSQTTARAGNHSTDEGQTSDIPDKTPILITSAQPFHSTTAKPTEKHLTTASLDPKKTASSTVKQFQNSVRIDVYPINNDETVTPIRFDATIEKSFESSLTNKSSAAFVNLARQFKVRLAQAFQNLSKFQSIEIIAFKNGSTTCLYNAVFKGVSKETPILDKEIQLVQQAIKLSKIGSFEVHPGNMTREIQTAMQTLKSDGCKILRNPCPTGFFCSSTGGYLTCVSYCLSKENKQHPCENGGHCFHDSLENTTDCRCAEDSKYVYSGRYCQIRAEKLALSSTYIIVISVSAGGGTILIFVIIIVVLIVKRRKSSDKKPPMGDKYERQSSYSMSEINIDRWNNPAMSRSRGSTLQNEYQSGLPDTKYVSGREHRVLKSDHGEEIYMYQPSKQLSNFHPPSLGPSDIETRSTRAESTYNYIDTEMTYQIKRPSVKVGYLNRI